MDTDEVPQHRLARLVKERRLKLKLSVRAAAKAAGIDRNTWSSLEDGSRVLQDRNYAKVEEALNWPTGEILRILSPGSAAADAAARQRIVEMSWAEIAIRIADVVETPAEEGGGPEEAGRQLDSIFAIKHEAWQRT